MAKKHGKLKGKTIASRLTGIYTPIGGISWIPPVDEADKARRLLVFLEDRRALYHPYDMEVGDYVVQSILEIRERLTTDLEGVSKSSILGESLTAMRAACRRFLDEIQRPRGRRYWLGPDFINCLGELRALFGIHVARLACAYDLEVAEELASILPPKPDVGVKEERTRSRSPKMTSQIRRR